MMLNALEGYKPKFNQKNCIDLGHDKKVMLTTSTGVLDAVMFDTIAAYDPRTISIYVCNPTSRDIPWSPNHYPHVRFVCEDEPSAIGVMRHHAMYDRLLISLTVLYDVDVIAAADPDGLRDVFTAVHDNPCARLIMTIKEPRNVPEWVVTEAPIRIVGHLDPHMSKWYVWDISASHIEEGSSIYVYKDMVEDTGIMCIVPKLEPWRLTSEDFEKAYNRGLTPFGALPLDRCFAGILPSP